MVSKIISVFILFLLSYLRHTFLININFKGEALFIGVMEAGKLSHKLSLASMICYVILFGFCNYFLATSFIKTKTSQWMLLYVALAVMSAFFYAVYLATDIIFIFSIGSVIKNFLLSPVFPVVVFILFKIQK